MPVVRVLPVSRGENLKVAVRKRPLNLNPEGLLLEKSPQSYRTKEKAILEKNRATRQIKTMVKI